MYFEELYVCMFIETHLKPSLIKQTKTHHFCPAKLTEDGSITKENGSQNGQHCLKPISPAWNYTVVARKVAKRIANVLRLT